MNNLNSKILKAHAKLFGDVDLLFFLKNLEYTKLELLDYSQIIA
jgi:hypothetical protein